MLEGAFSFRGRIGRWKYFVGCLLMAPGIFIGAFVIGLLMAGAQRGLGSVLFFGFLFLLLGIAVIWYSLSLYVRRFRDIGWDPATMLIGWVMIDIADAILAKIVPSMALGHAQMGTALGALVNFGLALALLFWPGHSGDTNEIVDVFSGPAVGRGPSRLDALVGGDARFESPAPALATPARLPGGAPQGFGRRGLR